MSEVESIGTVSLIRQGDHRFYSLTIPSDVLAVTCFIISRDEYRSSTVSNRKFSTLF